MSWFEQTPEFFGGLRLWDLQIDEAYVNFSSSRPLFVYTLAADCDRCPFTRQTLAGGILKINTAERPEFKVFGTDKGKYAFDNSTDFLCHDRPAVGEFGVYDVTVDNATCKWVTALDPVSVVLPLLAVAILVMLLTLAYKGARRVLVLRRTQQQQDSELEQVEVKKRLKSLDTFRGIAIVLMIFVNSGGGGYWWIEHATWDGLHVADVVFPWFLWIMGVCIPMSIRSQLSRTTRWAIFWNVVRRSLTLFSIGVCLNSIGAPDLQKLRIFGVLQRFGVAYLVVSCLMVAFMKSQPSAPESPRKRAFFDIIQLIPQYAVMAVIIFAYLLIIFVFPVPNCSSGYLGPGGTHNNFEVSGSYISNSI